MSGRHFNFTHFHIQEFVEQLTADLEPNTYNISDANASMLRALVPILETVATIVKDTDLHFAGDIGDNTFHSRLSDQISTLTTLVTNISTHTGSPNYE